MQLIGLDVGFSARRRTSAIATFAHGTVAVQRTTASVEDRVKAMGPVVGAVGAIDAPLGCDESTIRPIEQLFARGLFQRRCKPGFSHVRGTGLDLRTAGANSVKHLEPRIASEPVAGLARLLWPLGNVVEAFPNAFLGVCVADEQYRAMPRLKRGRKFDWLYDRWCETELFERLLDELRVVLPADLPTLCKGNHDHEERAALICLLTAASVATNRYVAVGEPAGGYFFLPPLPIWADWALAEVDLQRSNTSIQVWVNGAMLAEEDSLQRFVSDAAVSVRAGTRA